MKHRRAAFAALLAALPGLASCTRPEPPRAALPAPAESPAQPAAAAPEAPPEACPPGTEGAPPACKPLPDGDGDGVADRFDACPDSAGPASIDSAMHGCPPAAGDPDKDGLRGSADACPFESGPDRPEDAASRGCPGHVRVTSAAVVLVSPIRFDIEKATLRPESMAVLDDVARVLGEHPEILTIEIQGHDNRKRDDYSMKLSQRRADAVMKALVAKGVEPARLQAKGYGLEVPLAMPDSEEGRRLNTRIELVIRQRR